MGVAVIESKCGAMLSLRTSFLLWAVPNRCCSSITTRAKFLNLIDFWIRAWVPIKIGISPFTVHFRSCALEISVQPEGFTLEGNLRQLEPVISPMFIGKCLKYCIKDSKC